MKNEKEIVKKKKKKGKRKIPSPNYLRHFFFFLVVLVFAYLITFDKTILLDFITIKILRKSANNKNLKSVYNKLVKKLGSDKVDNSLEILEKFSRDASHHPPGFPDLVAYPDVQTILRVCNKKNMIVIPMGLNTGLEGQTIAYDGGVIVNMMRMKKIVKLYEDDFQITVEPGLRISEINKYLEEKQFFFPVAPGSDPSVGGAVSTGASGTLTPMYYTMKENVVNLEVVLPNGDVVQTKQRSSKSAAGYDLTSLFIGSEGTFGVITKITLKLSKIPKGISAAVVNFDDLESAAKTVIGLKSANIPIARMEIVNVDAIESVNNMFGTTHELKPSLFLEFHGSSKEDVENYAVLSKEICSRYGGSEFKFTTDEEERKKLWHTRHAAYHAASKIRDKKECPKCRLFSTDVCVPISKFAEIITETEKDFRKVISPINWADEREVQSLNEINKKLVKRAIEFEGTCTGEHGIGVGKKYAMKMEFNEAAINLMKSIKNAIDPKKMMNPNKII